MNEIVAGLNVATPEAAQQCKDLLQLTENALPGMSRLLLTSIHINNLQSRIGYAIKRMVLHFVQYYAPHQEGAEGSGGNRLSKLLRLVPGKKRHNVGMFGFVPLGLVLYLPHLGLFHLGSYESLESEESLLESESEWEWLLESEEESEWWWLSLLWLERHRLNTLRTCNLRLTKSQHDVMQIISRHRFVSLSAHEYLATLVQFAVHACAWSIAAIHAFRDPDSCDWSTLKRFPPKQKPTLLAVVLNKLIETLDTPAGAEILSSSAVSEITAEQQLQLAECMHGVVKNLTQ